MRLLSSNRKSICFKTIVALQLEKWWEEKGYLELGIPMAPFMNLIGPGPYINHHWGPQKGTQLERAGIVLHYTTKFWQLLRRYTYKCTVVCVYKQKHCLR